MKTKQNIYLKNNFFLKLRSGWYTAATVLRTVAGMKSSELCYSAEKEKSHNLCKPSAINTIITETKLDYLEKKKGAETQILQSPHCEDLKNKEQKHKQTCDFSPSALNSS